MTWTWPRILSSPVSRLSVASSARRTRPETFASARPGLSDVKSTRSVWQRAGTRNIGSRQSDPPQEFQWFLLPLRSYDFSTRQARLPARLKSDLDSVAGWGGTPGGRPGPQPTPVGQPFGKKSAFSPNDPGISLYRRRLPHDYATDQPVFLTLPLSDSLPATALPGGNRPFWPGICRHGSLAGGSPFWAVLPTATGHRRHGRRRHPVQRRYPRTLRFGCLRGHAQPRSSAGYSAVPLPKLTRSLKGITGKRANTILAMTGSRFWQEESYDHLVRNDRSSKRSRAISSRIRCGQDWLGMRMSTGGRARDGRPGGRLRTRESAPPPPGGCKYRVRSDSLDWPTLTRIAHFRVVVYRPGCPTPARTTGARTM